MEKLGRAELRVKHMAKRRDRACDGTQLSVIQVTGKSISTISTERIARLSEVEFWETDKLWTGISASLPNYGWSKFQSLMPPWIEREVVARYLLDLAGTWHWPGAPDRVSAANR